MTDSRPHLQKHLYTRVMDFYRHRDIFIPGFATIARLALKTKAEFAYRRLAASSTPSNEQIARWFEQHRFFFGHGVFRSGTTFLSSLLSRYVPDAMVLHEANVNDYWYYARAIHSKSDALQYLKDYRLRDIYQRAHTATFSTYGEINPFLRRHCEALARVLPAARQFQIVRNPRKVLRSLMSRELLGSKDPMEPLVYPNDSEPFAATWKDLDRFQKVCWLWASDNRFIRTHVHHCVKFELLTRDFDYFEHNILDYLGLKMAADDWSKEVARVNNPTPRHTFPKYSDWSPQQKASFEKICGEELAAYGY